MSVLFIQLEPHGYTCSTARYGIPKLRRWRRNWASFKCHWPFFCLLVGVQVQPDILITGLASALCSEHPNLWPEVKSWDRFEGPVEINSLGYNSHIVGMRL